MTEEVVSATVVNTESRRESPDKGCAMHEYLSVGEAARRIGVRPRLISHAIYEGKVNRDQIPLVSGRRLIPVGMLGQLAEVLK